MNIDNATAFLEGFFRGYLFRQKELNYGTPHQRRCIERSLSAWWRYSRSAAGQLAGCPEHGCYRCPSPKLMACPRSVSIRSARESRQQTAALAYSAYQADNALRDGDAAVILYTYHTIVSDYPWST